MSARFPLHCLALFACISCAPRAATDNADESAIRSLIAQYTASIDAADPRLGAEIWSTSANSTFIHPMGHERGWADIEANVYRKLMGGMFSERKLTARDISVHLQGDSAWAEFYWSFQAKLKANGAPFESQGRETQIFNRDPQRRWRLVHVHYSPLPSPAPPPGQGL